MAADLAIDLSDASHISGAVEYFAREGQTRIQDYLNRPERFIALRQGETVLFVNKRHVARFAPVRG